MNEQSPIQGIVPSLQELVEMRGFAQGRRSAKHGRYGVQGHALSNLRGRGMEYAESREYAAGDDARYIDWRLTARTGKAHTKLFQAERERLSLIVADTSPLLYFGTRVRFKSVQAARAGALMAWLALKDGDRIAALRGSRMEAPVAPAMGTKGVMRVLNALARWYTQPQQGDHGLAVALDQAKRLLRPGSRLLLLAEAASVLDVPEGRWAALAKFDCTVLLFSDPLERQPPVAQLAFMDAQGERVELALAHHAVRQRWEVAFEQPVQQAKAYLQRNAIRAVELSSDAPSESWMHVLDHPRMQRKGAV